MAKHNPRHDVRIVADALVEAGLVADPRRVMEVVMTFKGTESPRIEVTTLVDGEAAAGALNTLVTKGFRLVPDSVPAEQEGNDHG